MIIKPLTALQSAGTRFKVFLAGSIEMNRAEDWQQVIGKAIGDSDQVCIFNPRRDSWNNDWKQERINPEFRAQVEWELSALEQADLIVFYFSPETRSPVSMLELGLFAHSGKVIVCCPEGFWRKGNIDIVCHRYGIPQVNDLTSLISIIQQKVYAYQSSHVD